MITREDLRELSQFRFNENENCAISFYFQPATPQNKAHREETILAKDLVRNALRQAATNGNDHCARTDLERIMTLAESLHGNQSRAKAVFAYGRENFWREFDLPPDLPGTQLYLNRRFHIKPMAAMLAVRPHLGIALLDRQRARLFELRLDELKKEDELKEQIDFFHPIFRRGKSDGYAGYDAGHAERRVADDVLHHFRHVASVLKEQNEKGVWEQLIVGCQEKNWCDFEPQLHSYVRQRVLGHFSMDVTNASSDEIKECALRVLHEAQDHQRKELVKEVLSHARGHRRGVTGLRRVLRALQMGEVQTLVMEQNYHARAVECTSCGYVDSHMVRYCHACGRATLDLEDVCDAIIPMAIRRDIQLFLVKDNPELDNAGNIGALLRFRAERNQPMSVAS
jgi:peptide subunit release factor 1 (eRF1)